MDSEAHHTSIWFRLLVLSILSFISIYHAMIGMYWQNNPEMLVAFQFMYNSAVVFLLYWELSLENSKQKEAEKMELPICTASMEANKTKSRSENGRWIRDMIFDFLKVVIAIAPMAFPISSVLAAASQHKLSKDDEIKYLFGIGLSAVLILQTFLFVSILRARGYRSIFSCI